MIMMLLLLLLAVPVGLQVVVEAKQASLVAILCFIKPKIISWHQKKQKASTASQVTDKQQPICS